MRFDDFTMPVILVSQALKLLDYLHAVDIPTTAVTMQNSTAEISDFYLRIIDDRVYWLTLAIAGFTLSVVTVVANFIVVAITCRDPQRALRAPPCLLIANLSASDFLVGLCVVLLVAFRDVYRSCQQQVPLPHAVRTFASYVLCTTLFVSSASMVALSTTCFVAINNPMEYKTKITKKRMYIFIALVWVIALLVCFLPATNIPEKTYLLIYIHTHISLPAVLLTVIYVKGLGALARRTRELQANGQQSVENNRRALERERNMAVTVTIILTIFFLTYLPQFIMIHLLYFCDSCEISDESITFHKIDVASSRFVFLNSAINPFIYAWRMLKYRRALEASWKPFKNKLCATVVPRVEGPLFLRRQRSRAIGGLP